MPNPKRLDECRVEAAENVMSIVMTRPLTFQILGSVEGLLLLEQKGIAHERKATNSLTMSSEKKIQPLLRRS